MDPRLLNALYMAYLRSIGAAIPTGPGAYPLMYPVISVDRDIESEGWRASVDLGGNCIAGFGPDPRSALDNLEHRVIFRVIGRLGDLVPTPNRTEGEPRD